MADVRRGFTIEREGNGPGPEPRGIRGGHEWMAGVNVAAHVVQCANNVPTHSAGRADLLQRTVIRPSQRVSCGVLGGVHAGAPLGAPSKKLSASTPEHYLNIRTDLPSLVAMAAPAAQEKHMEER